MENFQSALLLANCKLILDGEKKNETYINDLAVG